MASKTVFQVALGSFDVQFQKKAVLIFKVWCVLTESRTRVYCFNNKCSIHSATVVVSNDVQDFVFVRLVCSGIVFLGTTSNEKHDC